MDFAEFERGAETAGEDRYRDIFESAPVSIWVEDWSAAKRVLDGLRRAGAGDLRAYFADHPNELRNIASVIEVLDVNWATVTLYRAPSKQAVIDSTLGTAMSDSELAALCDQVVGFSEGKTAVVLDATEERFDGRVILTRNHAVMRPQHVEDWSRVVIAVFEVAGAKPAERVLGADYGRLADVLSGVPCTLYRRMLKPDGTVEHPYVSGAEGLLPLAGGDDRLAEAMVAGEPIHPDDRGRWREAWRRSAEMLAPLDLEYRIVPPSGLAVWIRNVAQPKRGAGGAVIWDGVIVAVSGGG